MAEKTNVPEIRFAGFTDPWEQRKLGEIARRVTRKNDGNESDLPLTISAQYGLVDQRTFFNNQVASKDMSGYYLLKKGEFAYNKSTSTDSPWGAIKRLLNYDKGCVSTLYICFNLIDADPDFLVTYYETNRWYKSVQLIAAEGARNHGLLNIAPDDFFDTVLSIPGQQQEQKLIGNYFSNLDNLITLHQRKYDKLCTVKKSMLEKMFPKPGETEPEIRFDGFTDPWEQRKLGELTTILSAARVHKEEWRTAGVPFYRSSDVMAALNGTENERAFISQELFEKLSAQSGAPQKGDVMVTGGGSVGTPYIVPDNKPLYTKDADLIWIKRNAEIDPKFLYSFFMSPIFKSYIRSISHVGTIAHYTIEQVKETPLLMPCSIVEQKAIGSFLGDLDSLITLHQRKLELLRNTKKSLLDRMFV